MGSEICQQNIATGVEFMIRKFVFALSLSTALCASTYSRAETISDTVTQALSSHPQIKEGKASVAAADQNIHEQRSGYFPVLALDSAAGRLHNNDMTTRADTASQGAASTWMGQGTVTITQPLFTRSEEHTSELQSRQ